MEKKCNLLLLESARQELKEIASLHRRLVGDTSAKQIVKRLKDELAQLQQFPHCGAPISDLQLRKMGYRILICGNYICIYRMVGETCYVYHIIDGRMEYRRLFGGLREKSTVKSKKIKRNKES